MQPTARPAAAVASQRTASRRASRTGAHFLSFNFKSKLICAHKSTILMEPTAADSQR
jgi:hypothetical protein